MYDGEEKITFFLGFILIILTPFFITMRDHSTGKYDANYDYHYKNCLTSEMTRQQFQFNPNSSSYGSNSLDCESYAKQEAGVWNKILIPLTGIAIAWYFLAGFVHGILMTVPFIRNFVRHNYYGVLVSRGAKLQGGEDFQFKSSFDLLEGFKENPTSQMYTDLTVAINLYTKKYPKFTSTVTEEDFKNYINWAIQETDNIFKDEPQKSKIQKESLTKLLNKLNKRITTTNE
jgi:hypothetical protein